MQAGQRQRLCSESAKVLGSTCLRNSLCSIRVDCLGLHSPRARCFELRWQRISVLQTTMARCCAAALCSALFLALCCYTASGVPFLKSIQHLLRSEEFSRHSADTSDADADRVTRLPGWGKVADRVYSG